MLRRRPLCNPFARQRAPGLLGLCCVALALSAGAQEPAAEPAQVASIITLEGEIDGLTERTLALRVERALADAPRFLVISIKSPGGELEASRTIAWSLNRLRAEHDVTTVAFVRGYALSGATMVAFGCELIAMAPEGQVGDVMPIRLGLLEPQLAEKFIAPVRKDLEQLAAERGYPVDLAAAMVDPSVELHRLLVEDERGRLRGHYLSKQALDEQTPGFRARIREDLVICPAGKLLVLGPDQALEAGVARLHADDEQALCRALETEFSIARVVPQEVGHPWWSRAVRFITWWPVKLLLFVVGVVALLASLAQPGMGVPEALFVLCFGAVFFGSYLIGLADWVEVVLLVVGLLLLAVEIFITPGFGLMGIAGLLCLGGALLLSFQRFVIPSNPIEWELLGENLAKTLLGGALTLLAAGVAIRLLPKTRLLGGLMHVHTLAAEPLEAAQLAAAPVGASGVAVTPLRPVGKVRCGEDVLDARARDGLVEQGTPVVVLGHQGYELIVAARPETFGVEPPEGPPEGSAPGEESGP